MKVTYSVVASGDLASTLHFRVVAEDDFDPNIALQQIIDYPTTQPTVIYLHADIADPDLAEQFIKNARERFNCNVTLVTWEQRVTRLWYLVDRVILITTPEQYIGLPATEVHFQFGGPDAPYPLAAPVGQTHFYAWAPRDSYDQLIEWIRQAPYPIGVATRKP